MREKVAIPLLWIKVVAVTLATFLSLTPGLLTSQDFSIYDSVRMVDSVDTDVVSLVYPGIMASGQVEWFIDIDDNLILLERDLNRISKFSARGHLIASIGAFGSDVGYFNDPLGLSSRDNGLNYYLLDSENYRVVRLNSNLQWIEQIDLKREYEGHSLGLLNGFAVNSYLEIYISDPDNDRILHLDVRGNVLDEIELDLERVSGYLPGRITISSSDQLSLCLACDLASCCRAIEFDNLSNIDTVTTRVIQPVYLSGERHIYNDHAEGDLMIYRRSISQDFRMPGDLLDQASGKTKFIYFLYEERLCILNLKNSQVWIYDPVWR